ncbi:MAG: prepilin-type N-terminal cleavage/methylation domain-containing protein [Alphaproteobacteria bacterium]|nr:prepilin-type N-terminal cleavage/methylation domain-containing protein [Alphaproteobacteria bacterium]
MISKPFYRRMRGFTLTEAAIVLGVVGVLLAAIWVAAAALYSSSRISTSGKQILQIAQATRVMHALTQSVDPALTAADLAKAGAIPRDLVQTSTDPIQIINIWDGAVEVVAANHQSGPNRAFTVTFKKVPREACSQLLMWQTGRDRDPGLFEAGANGVLLAEMPTSLTEVNSICNKLPTEGYNEVFFTFSLKV